MIEIGIIGGAGFTGRELLELLSHHQHFRVVHLTSDRHAGKSVAEVFPELDGKYDLVFKTHEDPIPERVPLFLAVPNDTSLEIVPDLLKKGHRIVDLSGAYRLHDREEFKKFYRLEHTSFELMGRAVYGMPELFRDTIKSASLVSNPGCYPTGSILPLYFLGEHRREIDFVSIDAKSGVSGAGGRSEDSGFSFNSVHENFRAYKILGHQHQPEIEEYAFSGMDQRLPLVFTPHLLPLFRGILSTITIRWKNGAPADLPEILRAATSAEPFIRLLPEPELIQLSRIQKTNFIDIGLRSHNRVTVIVSAIDNLVKGAAGQAIQNMNLMHGLEETEGLC
jgi:N-acetyl-gamma-glutamyl-phosphate reductase